MNQMNYYFPYGGPWDNASTFQGLQPFKYNGKELDRVHGLDWYDYGARRYDPAFVQFTQMDPLCEQYPHLSPYAYCAGNPVNRGSDGGCRCRWWSGGWTTISKNRGKMPMVVHGVDHCQHLREAYDGDKPLVPEIRAQPGRGTYTCGT